MHSMAVASGRTRQTLARSTSNVSAAASVKLRIAWCTSSGVTEAAWARPASRLRCG